MLFTPHNIWNLKRTHIENAFRRLVCGCIWGAHCSNNFRCSNSCSNYLLSCFESGNRFVGDHYVDDNNSSFGKMFNSVLGGNHLPNFLPFFFTSVNKFHKKLAKFFNLKLELTKFHRNFLEPNEGAHSWARVLVSPLFAHQEKKRISLIRISTSRKVFTRNEWWN